MGFDPSNLPPHLLRLMSEKDRKALGKGAQLPEESQAKAEARNERELQGMMVNLLRLRGIEVLWHRTDKKSHATLGWPDLTFSVLGHDGHQNRVWACAIEVKMPGAHLDERQRLMRKKMVGSPNHWTCRTLRSLDELRTFLDGLGL